MLLNLVFDDTKLRLKCIVKLNVITTSLMWLWYLYMKLITLSIQKLQLVYNVLARVLLQQLRISHARPLLRALHWLPVSQRIWFKVAVLTYKIRSTSGSAYLHSLLSNHISESTATLWSASWPLLHVSRTQTVYGSRAFSVAAPTLWNSLSADINTKSLTAFRNSLKTFLFDHTSSGCSAD